MEKKDFYLTNNEIKQKRQDATSGSWGKLALASLIAFLIISILPITALILAQFFDWYVVLIVSILAFFVFSLINYGYNAFMLEFTNSTNCKLSVLFCGFSKLFLKIFFLHIVLTFVILVGYALFVVPGIILTLRYSMTMYCLRDNPKLSIIKTMKESARLMQDNKMRLFKHFFTNFHWTILFANIGDFWLLPKYLVAKSIFYDDLKTEF